LDVQENKPLGCIETKISAFGMSSDENYMVYYQNAHLVISKVDLSNLPNVEKAVSKQLDIPDAPPFAKLLALSNKAKVLLIHSQELKSKWTVSGTGSQEAKPKIQTKIYSVSTKLGSEVELLGHTDIITCASFINSSLFGGDNNEMFMLVTASHDATVRLWSITKQANTTSLTINCITIFTLFAGASSHNLRIVHTNKENGAYGQMVIGDLYGRVYWLQLLKKDL